MTSEKEIKVLIFDFFGTLVDCIPGTGGLEYEHTYSLFRRYGLSAEYAVFTKAWDEAFSVLSRETAGELTEFHMRDAARYTAKLLDMTVPESSLDEFGAAFIDEWNKGVVYKPAIGNLITELSKSYKLGLVSNTHYSPLIYDHLAKMAVRNYFSSILTSADYGFRKPHPSIFRESLNQLGVKANAAIFIGDSFNDDYSGAATVKMRCLLIDPGNTYRVVECDRIDSVFDIPAKLTTLL